MDNQNKISWQAYEFKHYEKNYGWYVATAAISILVIGFFVINRDIFAAISLGIMAIFILFFFAGQKPQIIEIEINTEHIKYGNLIFPYKQIKYFWIVNNERHKTLNFHTTALLNNVMIFQLENQEPEKIRSYLIQHVPEHEETEETFAQKIMHSLKF
jgi:hypothetical protein